MVLLQTGSGVVDGSIHWELPATSSAVSSSEAQQKPKEVIFRIVSIQKHGGGL